MNGMGFIYKHFTDTYKVSISGPLTSGCYSD